MSSIIRVLEPCLYIGAVSDLNHPTRSIRIVGVIRQGCPGCHWGVPPCSVAAGPEPKVEGAGEGEGRPPDVERLPVYDVDADSGDLSGARCPMPPSIPVVNSRALGRRWSKLK